MAALVIFLMCMLPAHALSDVVNVGDVASAGSLSTDPTPAPPVTTTPAPPVTTTPAPPVTTTPVPPITTTPAPPPPVTTTPAPPPPGTTTPAPPPATTAAPPGTTTPAPPRTTSPAEAGFPPDEWTPSPTTAAPATTTAGPATTTAAPTTTTAAPTTNLPTTTTSAPTNAGSTAGLTSPGNGSAADNTADGGGSSEGGKYALVIAAAVVVAVVLLASIYVVRRHRSKKEETAAELRRRLDDLDMELGDTAYALAKAPDAVVAGQGQGHSGSGNGRGSHSRSSFPFQKLVSSPASRSSSRTTVVSSGERDSLSGAWRDPEILAARIPYEKLRFRDLLSRGGFGEVFRGVYHDRPVAIKRLLPENRRRMAALEDFLKEAQLLTMLEHERIVAFIGVAWDSPRDLCIVLEFMPKGDLRNLLSEWREQGRRTGWGDVRKVRIALHVAEALTYLHTLSSKVVHRDLKSKNVLLDDQWQAKLSDFGVSREESTHNTMTTNVGSSLWIAPEVMMGNNYDEKADIFSFGVVLTELDLHQLPYYNAMTPDGRKMPDAAVLHLVTMGKLQAEFSSMSRTDIVLLGRSCLALDPKQRPSAADLRFRLSQILGSY